MPFAQALAYACTNPPLIVIGPTSGGSLSFTRPTPIAALSCLPLALNVPALNVSVPLPTDPAPPTAAPVPTGPSFALPSTCTSAFVAFIVKDAPVGT